MFGQQNGAPTGPMLLLRSLGFDPQAIAANVEEMRGAASQCVAHFDARLQRLETQHAQILGALQELLQQGKPQ